ncbi:hypothetical protein BJY52DRAFT_1184374 [Lactarius psammicola]|nr:hypothetical protein BJY52DRAFT_1184374 [Lactarius psammicola]
MGKQRKRKAIPAALHSEISEYASLLRVLRATDTLDIATHLTRLDSPHETDQATFAHDGPGQRESPTSSRVESKRATSTLDEETGRSSPEADFVHPGRSWKNWTRWPLVPEDVHLPEWGFEDEVYSLAKQVLLSDVSYLNSSLAGSSRFRGADSDDSNVLIEDRAEVLLPPSSLRALADVSSSHLERILSALASYNFSMEESTHDRSHPIGWESVLNVVGTAGLVDGNIIRNVKSRLTTIYGSQTDVIDTADDIGNVEPPMMVALHDLDVADIIGGENSGNWRKEGLYEKPSRGPPTTTLVHPRAGTSSSDGEG